VYNTLIPDGHVEKEVIDNDCCTTDISLLTSDFDRLSLSSYKRGDIRFNSVACTRCNLKDRGHLANARQSLAPIAMEGKVTKVNILQGVTLAGDIPLERKQYLYKKHTVQ
jgi:hypothetical protein